MSIIKERIRNLLELAGDDGAADQEVDNALKFARRLMLKHNIDDEDLAEPRDPHEIAADIEYGKREVYSSGARVTDWERDLGSVISMLIGSVNHYRDPQKTERRTPHGTIDYDKRGQASMAQRIFYYGPVVDVVEAAELHREWAETVVAMARLKFGGALRGEGRSYAEGFVEAMCSKVAAQRSKESRAIDAGRSLPLSDGEECTAIQLSQARELIQVKSEYGRRWLRQVDGIRLVRSGGSGGRHYGNAHKQGRRDGSRAKISRSVQRKLGN